MTSPAENRKARSALERANRALEATNTCSRAILQASDEHSLLQEICRILVEVAGYRMAWVAYRCDDDRRSITLEASHSMPAGYLDTAKITWRDDASGRGPTGTAIRERRPIVNQDFATNPALVEWRAAARQAGFGSSAAFPLLDGSECIGAINLYAVDPQSFDADEVELLGNFASTLSYGIRTLRLRQANERINRALEESQVRLRLAQSGSRIGVWELDLRSGRVYWSPETEALYGVPVGSFGGTQEEWWRSIYPADRPGVLKASTEALFDPRPFEIEFRIQHTSGDVRWLSSRGEILRDETGEPAKVLGVNIDVTERRRADEQLRMLYLAVEQSPESIVVTDLNAGIVYVNAAFLQVTGYSREDVMGRNPRILQSGQVSRATYEDMWARLSAGKSWEGELVNKAKSGRLFTEFARISPVRQSDGSITHFLAIKQDITQKRQAESEQRALEEQLRQAQKMETIGHLTGGIAHDFNNILAAMMGYTEIALMSPVVGNNEVLNSQLNEVLRGGIRAKELVAQLLTFSRKQETAAESISVAPIVREVVRLMQSTLPATIALAVDLHDELGEVRISPVHLHQILMNLCVNARDAITDYGNVTIRVAQLDIDEPWVCSSCRQPVSGPMVSIAVSDTGCGIEAANLERIFDPFFTTKPHRQSSGLGLSVLHGLVHSAGGHVLVETTPGTGTRFEVLLPKSLRRETPPATSGPPLHAERQFDGRILVVDDEPAVAGFLATLLRNFGGKVEVAADAVEALRLINAAGAPPDLVITDQTMPHMTGIELAATLSSRYPNLPILLCTGYGNAVDESAARAAGIRRVLHKPVPVQIICEAVTQCLTEARGKA